MYSIVNINVNINKNKTTKYKINLTVQQIFHLVYRQRHLQNKHKQTRHEALTKHDT